VSRARLVLIGLVALALAALVFASTLMGSATVEKDTSFTIPAGASVAAVADKLEAEGLISSAPGFVLQARIFGSDAPIQAGEFLIEAGMSQREILAAFQSGDVIRRFVTIPEGMPSILVWDRLMAEELLTGEVAVPPEGSILPDTYAFERGQSRKSLVEQMQAAMDRALAEEWAKRRPGIAVDTMRDALILAAIVEKETGKPEERRMVAGLYSNRVRTGMRLQADPTIIYPITKGKPLGRRIRQSEIAAVNGYNTYTRVGLPEGPITNPGRASIAAVLNPENTAALFMVADGTGGHWFADTLAEHNANVAKWYAIRRERGEMELRLAGGRSLHSHRRAADRPWRLGRGLAARALSHRAQSPPCPCHLVPFLCAVPARGAQGLPPPRDSRIRAAGGRGEGGDGSRQGHRYRSGSAAIAEPARGCSRTFPRQPDSAGPARAAPAYHHPEQGDQGRGKGAASQPRPGARAMDRQGTLHLPRAGTLALSRGAVGAGQTFRLSRARAALALTGLGLDHGPCAP
jgi:UPF0755 protein